MKKRIACIGLLLAALLPGLGEESGKPPVRIAIIGLTHVHVYGFMPRVLASPEVQLVGIVEPDAKLVAKCAQRYHLNTNLFHPTIADLFAKTNVQAVATFTSTFDHKRVVEECAPHRVPVMMEKPLAVNMEHARAIEAASKKGGFPVLVNYETTWYPANREAYKIAVEENGLGELRKIVVHDGHPGPKEIGCPPEFLEWLTDPVLDGGGALMDFGCYGADLMTWLMQGERPTSVFAVTQQFKPDIYPKVDDEATIVVTYPKAQGIIQASWNWPFNRKDMEIYGKTGQLVIPKSDVLLTRIGDTTPKQSTPPPIASPEADPLSYLAAITRGEIKASGLSSLEVNMVVSEILNAARESAKAGKRVYLDKDSK